MELPGSQHTAVLLGYLEARWPRRYRLCARSVCSGSFIRRYCQYQSTTTNRGLNLWLERVESPGFQRTAVILVSRGVTLLACGFGQLVFVMPLTFVSFTETRNDKTKRMNLLLERVESPGPRRTAVILVLRGVTLLVCGFGQWVFLMPLTFVPFTETRNDKTKWMNLLLERVESPGSQRTAVILVSRGVTLLVCGFSQLVFVMPLTFVPCTETRNDKTK